MKSKLNDGSETTRGDGQHFLFPIKRLQTVLGGLFGALKPAAKLALATVWIACLCFPVEATLPSKSITSSGPITKIIVGVDGSFQVLHTPYASGQIYPAGSSMPADAGFFLRHDGIVNGLDLANRGLTAADGTLAKAFHPISQTLAGSGLQVTTVMDNSTDGTATRFRVTQVTTYNPGDDWFLVENTVSNQNATAQTVDMFAAADIYLATSDYGYGLLGDNCGQVAVGGSSSLSRTYNILVQAKAGSPVPTSYQESEYYTIWDVIGTGAHFNNTVALNDLHDNGAGLEWRGVTIPAYGNVTISYYWAFGNVSCVIPTTRCMQITNQSVACFDTNMTYLWTFCVTNTWTEDIQYLSFPDLPAGFTINEEIVTLNPILHPGEGACFTLRIVNTNGPTNLCFTVGAHTTNFNVCCSVTNCLTFAPCCVWFSSVAVAPIPGMTDCYTYNPGFIRNVSSTPMKYLFFVPQPDAPNNCFSFSPNIMVFDPPLLPNQLAPTSQRSPQTLTLKVNPGCPMPLRFLASAHDSNLVNCCSSREYITALPRPVTFPPTLDGSVFAAGSTVQLPVVIDDSVVGPRSVTISSTPDSMWANSCIVPVTNGITGGLHDDWFTVSNVVAGTYTLRAELIDSLGGVWSSAPANVTVLAGKAPAPRPVVQAAALADGQVSFSLPTEAGVACRVEYTDSLAAPNWTVLRSIVGDGSVMTVTDSVTNAPQRFYRVRMQ